MKKRYSSAKPYGEWLSQEVVTLAQIVDSVPADGEAAARDRQSEHRAMSLEHTFPFKHSTHS